MANAALEGNPRLSSRLHKNNLLLRVVLLGMGLCVGAFAAQADVYGDAVFWFRGGKDANGDGLLNPGTANREFFNEVKASTPDDASQTCTVRGFTDGILLETEPVVFPCQPNVTQDLQCIRFKQELKFVQNADGSVTTNGHPNEVNLPIGNLITGDEYACVIRLRRDGGYIPDRTEDLLAFGYKNPIGWLLRIDGKDSTGARYLSRYTNNGPTYDYQLTNMLMPTNEWMDIGVSVKKLGDGKTEVRLALARAELPVMFNRMTLPATQSFKSFTNSTARSSWRLGTQATPPASPMEWHSLTNGTYKYSSYPFRGSVQQLAFWNRPLSDDEIYEAFGMPRPNLMQVGVGNDSTEEFGAARTAAAQTIDATAQTWRDKTAVLQSDDAWTITFNVNAAEAGLGQLCTFKSTSDSVEGLLKLSVNGHALSSRMSRPGGETVWFVPRNMIVAGANAVLIQRVDNGAGALKADLVKLGGSWQAGLANNSNLDLVGEAKKNSLFFSSADLGWKHWCSPLTTYHAGLFSDIKFGSASNQVYHVWVDAWAAGRCAATLSTSFDRTNRSAAPTTGNEYVDFKVNGTLKRHLAVAETPSGKWMPVSIKIEAEELVAGWNVIAMEASPTRTCFWYRDFFRFELEDMPNGTFLIIR